ncbi:MAG: hypothetical protein O7A64_02705 [Alphaproteobacteria bacterium]|nr:hypothetical protein [Alphaproteobacteria bacterium]
MEIINIDDIDDLQKACIKDGKLMVIVTNEEGTYAAYGLDPGEVAEVISDFKERIESHQVDPVACAEATLRKLMAEDLSREKAVLPALVLVDCHPRSKDARLVTIAVEPDRILIEGYELNGPKTLPMVH